MTSIQMMMKMSQPSTPLPVDVKPQYGGSYSFEGDKMTPQRTGEVCL